MIVWTWGMNMVVIVVDEGESDVGDDGEGGSCASVVVVMLV